jgi:hypothetical protein
MHLWNQDSFESKVTSDGSDLTHVVTLRTPSRDQSIAVLGQGGGDDIFELSNLVATKTKTRRTILTFCPDLGFGSGSRVEIASKIGKRMQWRRMVEKKRSALEGSERLG